MRASASAAKLALGVVAWLTFGAAAFLVLQFEQQLTHQRSTTRAFDVVARESVGALAGAKAALHGYVAPGQGPGFWTPRADDLLTRSGDRIAELQKVAASDDGRTLLTEALGALRDLRAIETRARQYLNSNQPLMAADVVFSEGGETADIAARDVERARQAETAWLDGREAATRHRQAYALGGAVSLAVLAIGVLALWPAAAGANGDAKARIVAAAREEQEERRRREEDSQSGIGRVVRESDPAPEPALAAEAAAIPAAVPAAPLAPAAPDPAVDGVFVRPELLPVSNDLPRDTVPVLTAAAGLCVELNRARDIEELTQLLGRASEVIDASGLVVWVGAPGAATLRPVLAHGYSPEALTRMPPVSRHGDNAAAAAFRTGKLQIVLTRPGVSAGALAAPMLTPGGCIGALTGEIKNGGEAHDGVQALMAIVAAQLAGVLAESVLQSEEFDEDAPVSRIASA